MIKLRKYQLEALEAIKKEYDLGLLKQLVVMPTGTGKSLVFVNIKDFLGLRKKTLFLVHRDELIQQAKKHFEKWCPKEVVEIEQASASATNEATTILASVQTLGRKGSTRINKLSPNDFDLIIIDECFPAGTLVDGKVIEDVKVGDLVSSYNEEKKQFEYKKVVRLFKSKPKGSLVELRYKNIKLICTENHPIYTKKGWKNAKNLSPKEEIMFVLPQRIFNSLEKNVFNGMSKENGITDNDRNEQKVCVRKNEKKQSNVQRTSKKENDKKFKRKTSWWRKSKTQRKWNWTNKDRKIITKPNWRNLFFSSKNKHGQENNWLSISLQIRYWLCKFKTWYRNRWNVARIINKKKTGQKESRIFEWVRLDNITIHKQTSDGTFGGLCSDGFVYNFEVEENNNYIANNILVHNCHHAVASSYLRVIDYFNSNKTILLVGFTATPNRSDAIGLNNVLQKIVYNYPIYHETEPSAIKDGYLVDIKGIRVQSDVGLDHIPTIAGDLAQKELEKTINVANRNELIVKSWTTYGENRPTIAFCSGIEHSKALAETFTNYNIKAEAVWGEDTQRKVKLEHFRNGKITVLTNCQLLGEGVDLPHTSSIIMARPTKSSLVYSQQLGRALRLPEGLHHISEAIARGLKKDAILIDIVDNTKRHSLITVPSILGLPLGLDLEGKSLLEAAEKIKELKAQNPETNYDKLVKLSEIDLYTEEVDLFDTTLAVEVADITRLNWRKTAENKYSIKYKQGDASIELNRFNLWAITAQYGPKKLDDTAISLRSAIIYADSWLKVHLDYFTYSLLKNDSKISKTLKKQKITEKQLNFLSNLKPEFKDKFSKLSKFNAARLIDKILSK